MVIFSSRDSAGNVLTGGDICVRVHKGKVEYVVYKKPVWGSKSSKGEYGRFITHDGESTIKFKNVLSTKKPRAMELIRRYYEEK